MTFEDEGGRTKVTLKHVGMPAGKGRDMAEVAWSQALEKLADVLVGTRSA